MVGKIGYSSIVSRIITKFDKKQFKICNLKVLINQLQDNELFTRKSNKR